VFAAEKYPGVPSVQTHLIENQPFFIGDTEIIPIRALHHQLPVLGFRIGDFTYITDANFIAPEELEKARGSRVLVLNALRHRPHRSHFTLGEAIETAKKAEVGQTYFTHISHDMGLHREIEPQLPENMFLAYDTLQLGW
jgi:phosphoribosyl 1,2-cyclic phosphate phosphodiesterase